MSTNRLNASAFALLVVGVCACSGGGSTSPAIATPIALAVPLATEEPDIAGLEAAQEHTASARYYWGEGDFGLALTELAQALAASPGHPSATRLQKEVAASATAERQRVVAQATAEAQRAAVELAARAEGERTAAIDAQSARLSAFVATFTRTAPKGRWLTSGVLDVGVGSLSYFTEWDRRSAPRGQRWVALGVGVQNTTTARIHVNPNHFTLITKNGESNPYDSLTHSWCATPLRAADVQPGAMASGCLVFMAPISSGPSKVVYSSPVTRNRDVIIDLERFPDFE